MTAQEKEEEKAYTLMQRMSEEVLELEIAQPTIEYTAKKRALMFNETFKSQPITVSELFIQQGWDKKLYKTDMLIWLHAEDPYLPYLYGYIENVDKLVYFSKHAHTQGKNKLLTRLTQIYKVITLRNQIIINSSKPKPMKIEKPWQDSIPLKVRETTEVYFKAGKTTYKVHSLQNAYCPSFKRINPKKKGIAHYYYMDGEEFMFVPVAKEVRDIGQPLNVSSLLTGNAVWPIGLDKLLLPMLAVENLASQYLLFAWLVRNKYQNNRGQNFYLVKPEEYDNFFDEYHRAGPLEVEETVSYKGILYGAEPREVEIGLFNIEMKARELALEDWENYE